jgi:allatostatin receptor
MTEADDFSPEDVFKLFPTAFPMRPKLPPPVVETTTELYKPTIATSADPGLEFILSLNGTWIFGEAEDTIILPLLLGIIGICSVIGNGLIVFVIIAIRRMRTGPNLMLLNVTCSDLVFMALCVPTAIMNHATPSGNLPPTGLGLCKFVHYMIFVTVYVSIYSLVVACVFRFFGDYMSGNKNNDRSPANNNPLLSRCNAVISSIVIWVAFFISHLKFLIQPEGAVFQEPFICLYSFVLPESTKIRTLWITFLTCAFLLPLLTICSLSAVILHRQRKLRKHPLAVDRRPQIIQNHPQSRSNTNIHSTLQQPLHPHQAQMQAQQYEMAQNEINERRNRREITMVLMASMVMRALFWLPIQVFIMIDIFGMTGITEVYRKAEMLGVCCAFAGTCMTPLLYNCLSLDFKSAFNETFRKMGCTCMSDKPPENPSDMNETIMSIISDSSNHINYN